MKDYEVPADTHLLVLSVHMFRKYTGMEGEINVHDVIFLPEVLSGILSEPQSLSDPCSQWTAFGIE